MVTTVARSSGAQQSCRSEGGWRGDPARHPRCAPGAPYVFETQHSTAQHVPQATSEPPGCAPPPSLVRSSPICPHARTGPVRATSTPPPSWLTPPPLGLGTRAPHLGARRHVPDPHTRVPAARREVQAAGGKGAAGGARGGVRQGGADSAPACTAVAAAAAAAPAGQCDGQVQDADLSMCLRGGQGAEDARAEGRRGRVCGANGGGARPSSSSATATPVVQLAAATPMRYTSCAERTLAG